MRTDIDGLPISEKSDVDFTSDHKGVMHACGHDSHMASLLVAIETIKTLSDNGEIDGKFTFLFQPAEETFEGMKMLLKDVPELLDGPVI
jgi:metal-dependent amidase/aminoacylase/carboxypeptidase family protein